MKRLTILLLMALSAFSCKQAKEVAVPYQEARNYFFRNDASIPGDVKVTDRATFESLFGMATVMGPDGKPTPIDWETEFVIAIVKPETGNETSIEPVSLTRKGKALIFHYIVRTGPSQSYTIRPILVITVSKEWESMPVSVEEETINP